MSGKDGQQWDVFSYISPGQRVPGWAHDVFCRAGLEGARVRTHEYGLRIPCSRPAHARRGFELVGESAADAKGDLLFAAQRQFNVRNPENFSLLAERDLLPG